ncbi:polysaccharide lyase, partial [Candidatus Saccharibacteria bacterium]|nr:polysaccharide lyase [Candidatus Saccharibacteria bacterium]
GTYAFTVSAFDAAGTYSAFHDYNMTVNAGGTGGTGGTAYGSIDFESGITSPWQGSQFFPTGTLQPQAVNDPLNQKGRSLLLEADYASSLPTNYTSAANQQTAISINPQYAHAGMDGNGNVITTGMETWYSGWVMAPSGNVFANGETNWLTEWHDTTGGAGPKSSGMFAFGGYPLTSSGTSSTKFLFRATVDVGGGNYQNRYFPGNYSDPNLSAPTAPSFTLGAWHRFVFHWIWSGGSNGQVEWWLDGTKYASYSGQTQAANDYYSWAVYNYRPNVTGSSKLYYDNLVWGPTAGSIGFTP